MAWKQDDMKSTTVSVQKREGKATIVSVTASPTTVRPGDNITIKGVIRNDGGRDWIKMIIGIQEYLEDLVEVQTWDAHPGDDFMLQATFTIPSDCTRNSLTAVAIGYHQE